jgi:hypothetical protein
MMSAWTMFRVAILLLLLGLGVLFVAASKTHDAIDGSATDDDAACLCFSSNARAA